MAHQCISLTTSFNTGDDYGDGPYTHVKVLRILRERIGTDIILEYAYGTNNGGFVQSSYPTREKTLEGSDYSAFEALVSSADETMGNCRDRCLCQSLLDTSTVAGTIVDI